MNAKIKDALTGAVSALVGSVGGMVGYDLYYVESGKSGSTLSEQLGTIPKSIQNNATTLAGLAAAGAAVGYFIGGKHSVLFGAGLGAAYILYAEFNGSLA
jgi:hypothetical protein